MKKKRKKRNEKINFFSFIPGYGLLMSCLICEKYIKIVIFVPFPSLGVQKLILDFFVSHI
jgi:hypothetical protein